MYIEIEAPQPRGSSPWGQIDDVREVAPGIVLVSTPSHGGVWLSPDRTAAVDPRWWSALGARPEQPPCWLEEDEEWAVAAATFSGEYAAVPNWPGGDPVATAHAILRNQYPATYEAVYEVVLAPGQSRRKDANLFIHERPEGCWLGTTFGDWHGLVPRGHVGVYVTEGNQAELAYARGDYAAGKRLSQATSTPVLIPLADYESAANDHHRWLGPAPASTYEPWPIEDVRLHDPTAKSALYSPLGALSRWRSARGTEESALRLVRLQDRTAGLLLDADAGRWDEVAASVKHMLDHDPTPAGMPPDFNRGSDKEQMRDMMLWMAARQGRADAVQDLLALAADPSWSSGLAARAARHHGHAEVLSMLGEPVQQPGGPSFG